MQKIHDPLQFFIAFVLTIIAIFSVANYLQNSQAYSMIAADPSLFLAQLPAPSNGTTNVGSIISTSNALDNLTITHNPARSLGAPLRASNSEGACIGVGSLTQASNSSDRCITNNRSVCETGSHTLNRVTVTRTLTPTCDNGVVDATTRQVTRTCTWTCLAPAPVN